jgi:DNA-binding MarR family transcriptional regulator
MPRSVALLLRDGYLTVDAEVRAALTAAGYTDLLPWHFQVLRNLGDDGARPVELAAKASITRQAVAKIVDELERIGIVYRDPDPDDGRGVIVRYTDRGLTMLGVARKRMADLEQEYAARLGAKRWTTVRSGLDALFGG